MHIHKYFDIKLLTCNQFQHVSYRQYHLPATKNLPGRHYFSINKINNKQQQ